MATTGRLLKLTSAQGGHLIVLYNFFIFFYSFLKSIFIRFFLTNLRRALTSALHVLLKDEFDDDDDDGDNEPEAGTDIRTPHAPQG